MKKTNFPYESAHFATISQIRTKSKNCEWNILKKDYFDYTIQTASNLAIESLNRFVVFMSGMQALDSKN